MNPPASPALACARRLPSLLVSVALTLATCVHAAPASPPRWGYEYLSPLPGARLVSPWNGLAVRPGGPVDAATARAVRLTVTGDRSGAHAGRCVASDDARTLVFTPERPFAEGERVTVSLAPGLRGRDGGGLPALSYSFAITPRDPRTLGPMVADEATGRIVPLAERRPRLQAASSNAVTASGDTLPAGYPTITLMSSDRPSAGNIFISPFVAGPGGNLMILDNAAQPMFYRHLPAPAMDFQLQPNGLLTYFDSASWPPTFWGLDSSYAVVDEFRAGNGYYADEHELQVLPNGHALLLCYDTEPVAMDEIVPGGQPDALVIGAIVQELDQAKNVVFQWRSWDHFEITDADTCLLTFRDALVDYVHANAIEVDTDGNLLLSSRSMSEITKIDRATGDIIWRMGPFAKQNQFSFPNDPRGFAAQHDIRRLANGHVTLFDNANCQYDSEYSRGAEYALDEVLKVATLVWSARNAPDLYSAFMGNVQREANGNTMLGWGGTESDPKVTEVHADGSPALALGFGKPGTCTYRAFRSPWRTNRFALAADSLVFGAVGIGNSDTLSMPVRNASTANILITSVVGQAPPFSIATPLPLSLGAGETSTLRVRFAPTNAGTFAGTFYVRSVSSSELVAQTLTVRGSCQASGIWIEDVARREGDSGLATFPFRVRLAQPLGIPVGVGYTTVDVAATVADSDYVPAAGHVTIAAGDTAATLDVAVRGDARVESNEAFFVALSDATGAPIDRAQAMGTILNDDGPLGVEGAPAGPGTWTLYPALPNPSRGATTIQYDLPRACRVRLDVYDLSGRRVQTLVDEAAPAGHHEVIWASSRGATGVFFCRLRAGDRSAVCKIVRVR